MWVAELWGWLEFHLAGEASPRERGRATPSSPPPSPEGWDFSRSSSPWGFPGAQPLVFRWGSTVLVATLPCASLSLPGVRDGESSSVQAALPAGCSPATASPSLSRLNSPNISCLFSHRNTSVIAPFPGFCTFLDAGEAQDVPNLGKRDHISLPPAPSKPDSPKPGGKKSPCKALPARWDCADTGKSPRLPAVPARGVKRKG